MYNNYSDNSNDIGHKESSNFRKGKSYREEFCNLRYNPFNDLYDDQEVIEDDGVDIDNMEFDIKIPGHIYHHIVALAAEAEMATDAFILQMLESL